MRILFIKNKITYDINDDINKFKDWLKRKTPLTYEFEELITNIDVKINDNAGGLNKAGIGLVEATKTIPPLYDGKKYDIIVFLYDNTGIRKQFVAKTYPFFNSQTICIESPITSWHESIDDLYRLLTHEIIHAFHIILRLKGITTEDSLDIYDGEMDIENGANRKRNLIMLAPHWSKFTESVKKYKWFSDKEAAGLKPELVVKLDQARELAGIPFVITSGYRTKDHNAEVGGVENSGHLEGEAVDLRARNPNEHFIITKALLDAGFTRISRKYPTHIHCDITKDKPQRILF